jgi:hypothetical protein
LLHQIKTHRNMTTYKAKSTMYIGSIKNGFMHIECNEAVNVVQITEKCLYISKDGMIKKIPKKQFYTN